jgi:hypothetical protein
MALRSLHCLPISLGVLFSLLALTNCGSSGSAFSYQNITLSVTPQITSVPVNGTVTFSSTTTNAPNTPIWTLYSFAYANLGSPTNYTGPTYVYTAPAAPPVYSSPGTYVNGTVTLQAVVFGGNFTGITSTQTFVITAPSVTTAITPSTATVPLSGTTLLNAYAVGNINNAVTLQVNGVAGGSTSTGTIVHTPTAFPGIYLYTAPATMPMSGNTVTITVISQADPTKTASSTITLQ